MQRVMGYGKRINCVVSHFFFLLEFEVYSSLILILLNEQRAYLCYCKARCHDSLRWRVSVCFSVDAGCINSTYWVWIFLAFSRYEIRMSTRGVGRATKTKESKKISIFHSFVRSTLCFVDNSASHRVCSWRCMPIGDTYQRRCCSMVHGHDITIEYHPAAIPYSVRCSEYEKTSFLYLWLVSPHLRISWHVRRTRTH